MHSSKQFIETLDLNVDLHYEGGFQLVTSVRLLLGAPAVITVKGITPNIWHSGLIITQRRFHQCATSLDVLGFDSLGNRILIGRSLFTLNPV
jgi:hypothetical protein